MKAATQTKLDQITVEHYKTAKGTFTPNHTKYILDVYYGKETPKQHWIESSYQFNPQYSKYSKDDFLQCFFGDAYAYLSCKDTNDMKSIDNFASEFGYEKVSECIKAFEGCKKAYEFLHMDFSDNEIIEVYDELNN